MTSALPLWPVARLEEALYKLGRRSARISTFEVIADTVQTPRDLQAWLYAAAAREGLEAQPLIVTGELLEDAIRSGGPMLVVVSQGAVALKAASGRWARLLTPDGSEMTTSIRSLCLAVRSLWAQKYGIESLDAVLEHANVPPSRRPHASASLLKLQLDTREIEVGWTIRPASSAPLGEQLQALGQRRSLIKLMFAFLALQLATIGAWYLLGKGALTGNIDGGWLAGWSIAFVSVAVLQVFMRFWEGTASIAIGAMLKKRLLLGALRSAPETLRHEGLARGMGRVLEAEALEELSLSGGFITIFAFLELLVAGPILFYSSVYLFLAFVGALVFLLWMCLRYYRRTDAWTHERMGLTHDLIEKLVGHRTRVVQGSETRVRDEEDVALARYVERSRSMDTITAAAIALIPRGTLLVGILALTPLFVDASDPVALWVGVGGILLAQRALSRLAAGVSTILEAGVALKTAAPLLSVARVPEEPATALGLAVSRMPRVAGEAVLEMRHVEFRFGAERPHVLKNADLTIRAGEHYLLEGTSGGGKSTLVGLLSGLHAPDSGMVLLAGLDRQTLGAAIWRRMVAAAPQHHENHVLQGSLAFNLLLGIEWPPTPRELAEAEQVCRELGLGDLLDRMPSRLQQTVGSTGWRLSHGEQSRVFIARALLQGSGVVLLDESLSALDPENLLQVMECVRRRADTLVLVAHP